MIRRTARAYGFDKNNVLQRRRPSLARHRPARSIKE